MDSFNSNSRYEITLRFYGAYSEKLMDNEHQHSFTNSSLCSLQKYVSYIFLKTCRFILAGVFLNKRYQACVLYLSLEPGCPSPITRYSYLPHRNKVCYKFHVYYFFSPTRSVATAISLWSEIRIQLQILRIALVKSFENSSHS